MRTTLSPPALVRLPVVIGSIFALGLLGALAPTAKAEFCRPLMPDHARDVKGYTFEAQVVLIRTEGVNPPLTYISMAVSKVYANRDSNRLAKGRTVKLYSNLCDGFGLVGLEDGDKVLMSTSALEADDGPRTWNTAIWRRDGGRLSLLVLHGDGFEKVWSTSDRRIVGAHTTREVLALVAPAAIGMPDTAMEPNESGPPTMPPILVAGFVGLLVTVKRFRPRSKH
jgi:hypothetical protein